MNDWERLKSTGKYRKAMSKTIQNHRSSQTSSQGAMSFACLLTCQVPRLLRLYRTGKETVFEAAVAIWLVLWNMFYFSIPRPSMYGIFTYIYPINDPNVGEYTIHGSSGIKTCMDGR